MSERRYRNPQVNLRLPEELKEKVSRLAEKHKRSANAEMVAAIEYWVEEYDEMESRQKTLELVNHNPDIRDNSPIRALLNEFVEKVTPFLEQEMDRRDAKKSNKPTDINKKPT